MKEKLSSDISFDEKKMQKADVPVSTRASSGKYADLSVNKDLELSQEELNETRIRPSPEKPKSSHRPPSARAVP